MAFCPYCGKEIEEAANFCTECGAKLTPPPAQAPAPEPAAPSARTDGFPPPERPAAQPAPAQKQKKPSKAPLVIGIAAGVLVLAAVLWGVLGRTLFAPYRPEEPADTTQDAGLTPQVDFWNGSWYGWWIIETGTGAYEDAENDWWDACAQIELAPDGSGTLLLWDDSCEAEQTIAHASVQASADLTTSGRLVSTDGSFFDCALTGVDTWYIDAAPSDAMPYADMICISGVYTDPENSGDSFVYSIYLRPWGMDWEDVRADDEGLLPYFYDDWYLPLIEAGESMPDAIGGSPA